MWFECLAVACSLFNIVCVWRELRRPPAQEPKASAVPPTAKASSPYRENAVEIVGKPDKPTLSPQTRAALAEIQTELRPLCAVCGSHFTLIQRCDANCHEYRPHTHVLCRRCHAQDRRRSVRDGH